MYTEENTLRVARRFNNPKRTWLLVNPLQAKHIPVSPAQALTMMETLGQKAAARWPDTRLVIGFAETATAIGSAVASAFGPDCKYLHTTRESFPKGTHWVPFLEEHSHAAHQKLCCDRLIHWLNDTDTVLFVEDELSTGKTLLNVLDQLKAHFPILGEKKLAAASLLNRLSPEDELRLSRAGLSCEYLVKLQNRDFAQAVEHLQVEEAPPGEKGIFPFSHQTFNGPPLPDPRTGVSAGDWQGACTQSAEAFLKQFPLPPNSRVLVLGTEEWMYPALILGRKLEEEGHLVLCHATTRSPIGVTDLPGYPITSGAKLPSFYEAGRSTYLYDHTPCDVLMVVSDTPLPGFHALEHLLAAWKDSGYQYAYYLQGGRDVWYL